MKYARLIKHKQIASTFLAGTVFAVGCKPSADENRPATADQFDKVKKETKDSRAHILVSA
jgi:hypothetical protein